MTSCEKERRDLLISPLETLIFQRAKEQSDFVKGSNKQETSCCRLLESRICLFNPTKRMMAFKVKVTSRQRYSVKPWIGVIKGDGEGEIVVTFRHPFPEENSIAEEWLRAETAEMEKDGVMICWREMTQIPTNEAKLAKVWDSTPSRAIRCCILQCQLEPLISIPTKGVLQKELSEADTRNHFEMSLSKEEAPQIRLLNFNCNNIKEKCLDETEIQEMKSPEKPETIVCEYGDSIDKRAVDILARNKSSGEGRKVTSSASYTVAYDECHEPSDQPKRDQSDFQSSQHCDEFLLHHAHGDHDNNSNVFFHESQYSNDEQIRQENMGFGRPGAVPSSAKLRVTRMLVNGVFFSALIAALTGAGTIFPQLLVDTLGRVRKCLSEKEDSPGFLCNIAGLWCEPRDPICDILDGWNPMKLLRVFSATIFKDKEDSEGNSIIESLY